MDSEQSCWMAVLLMGAFVVSALWPVSAVAACYDECEMCAADPVFIQADRRNPEAIIAHREAKAKGDKILNFADGTMVIIANEPIEGTCETCSEKGSETAIALSEAKAKGYGVVSFVDGTTVIIGDSPTRGSCKPCGGKGSI